MSSHDHTPHTAAGTHDNEPGAGDVDTSASHHHVLPLKVYYGVWGALMALTAVTIAAAYEPFAALRVPIALGIATIKATLVALFFMHLLYDEKFNLVLLISAVGVALIFLTLTIVDPLTRGLVNPISLKPIAAEMTTTTLDTTFEHDKATEEGGQFKDKLGPSQTPVVPSPATVGPAAEFAHPGAK